MHSMRVTPTSDASRPVKPSVASDASSRRLLGDVDSLDKFEISHFERIAKYMKPNPRAIKRISSMYRLARLMVFSRARSLGAGAEREALLRRLLVWIVLCEQWPVHMAWSLQVLEDMHQLRHLHEILHGDEDREWLEDDPEKLSFREFYQKYVKHHVFNVHQRHCPEPLRQRYQRIFLLEHDKEMFDCLIADGFDIGFKLRVEHIGTLMRARDATMLISYCTNLNPALVSLLSLVKSVPQSADDERYAKDLVEASEHKHDQRHQAPPAASEATPSQQQEPPSEIAAAEPETSSAQASSVARGGDASAVEQVVQKPDQAKKQAAKVKVSLMKDDKTGRDHIGSADYALCLASLIFGALQPPCVIGIYAQWGTGKSFMMEKITAALKALQLEQVLLDELPDELPENFDPNSFYLDDLRGLLANDEEQIQLMFKWLQMGLPELPHSAFSTITKGKKAETRLLYRYTGLPARLDSKYFDRLEAANEQLDVTPIWLICQLVARLFVAICKPILLLSNRCAHLVRGPAFNTSSAPMLNQLMKAGAARRRRQGKRLPSMHEKQSPSCDYHYIWWNAWLYSGSDNLWAGLIKALHEAVEERYGAPYVRRCR